MFCAARSIAICDFVSCGVGNQKWDNDECVHQQYIAGGMRVVRKREHTLMRVNLTDSTCPCCCSDTNSVLEALLRK